MEELADSWVRITTGKRVWHSVCSFDLFGEDKY